MGQSNYVHLDNCRIVRAGERAILVELDDGVTQIWIPRSQIADEGSNLEEGDDEVTVSITEWIAKQKGIES